MNWSLNLGNLSDGRSAETIHLREKTLSPTSYTPAALIYSPPAVAPGLTNPVEVITTISGALRQIKAPENLADIVTITATEYDVRLYRLADVGALTNGVYAVSGTPLLVWKVKNPDPSTTNRLQLIKTQGALTETHEYTWDARNDMWTLTQGGANGTRVETETTSYPTAFSRTVTNVVKDGTGAIASKRLSGNFSCFYLQ